MASGARLVQVAAGLAVLGGVLFIAGLDSGHDGPGWAGTFALVGIALLVAAALLVLAAALAGIAEVSRTRRLRWWLPVALAGAGFALWVGWIVLHL